MSQYHIIFYCFLNSLVRKYAFLVGRMITLRCPMMNPWFWWQIRVVDKDQRISYLKSYFQDVIEAKWLGNGKRTHNLCFHGNSATIRPLVLIWSLLFQLFWFFLFGLFFMTFSDKFWHVFLTVKLMESRDKTRSEVYNFVGKSKTLPHGGADVSLKAETTSNDVRMTWSLRWSLLSSG